MNPKKAPEQKAKNSGISLEPNVKDDSAELAKLRGFKSLSAFTSFLLSRELKKAAAKLKKAGSTLEQRGKTKVEKARKKK